MKNFYLNHDSNMDDFTSLLLMLLAPGIKLIGVGVTDADGYVEPGVSASRTLLARFNQRGDKLEVAKSDSRAVHQFPEAWRVSAFSVDHFPILNEKGMVETPVAAKPAHLDMIDKVHAADGPVTLVFTGPLTDLARALEIDPSIQDKIEELYWMGGSVNAHGNVYAPCADGTQEWNAWWDPEACKTVWDSKIKIQQVGLESTEELPLTDEMRQHFASNRKYPAFEFLGYVYALVNSFEVDSTYYLWDVLTTMSALYPEIATTRDTKSDVYTDGDRAARFFETENGRPMTLVTSANYDKFWERFDDLCEKAQLF